MFTLPWDVTQPRTPALFLAQLQHYFQYFDWQWSRGVQGADVLLARLRLPFTLLFIALGLWGAVQHRRRDRASFFYLLVLFGTLSLGLIVYLNFRYGYSIGPDQGNVVFHEVRERDYFFIASFSVWGLWAGVGLVAIWAWLAKNLAETLMKASPILMLALIPLVLNWNWASRAGDYAARDTAYNLLMSVEPYVHHGRQRHLPALVPAGGRGHTSRRHRDRDVVPRHTLVHEADPGPDEGMSARRLTRRRPDADHLPASL